MPHVTIADRTIHYRTAAGGSTGAGRRVLYVHGTGCSGLVWQPHMDALAGAHTAVAIDLPGHGLSPGPGYRGVGDYTYFAVELARALGWDRFVVAGHSLGGAIALLAALHHQELLEGLVLVDTGARLRVNPALLRGARAAAEAGRPARSDRSWGFADATPQAIVDAVERITGPTDPRVTYADWVADDTFDVMSRVGDIRLPALIACGAQDRLTPVKYHQFLAERMPGSRLRIVEGAGHWMFWERPEAFTSAVREFLDTLPK